MLDIQRMREALLSKAYPVPPNLTKEEMREWLLAAANIVHEDSLEKESVYAVV